MHALQVFKGVVVVDVAGSSALVHLVQVSQSYVEHIFWEELRQCKLMALEARRPQLFMGMGAKLHRGLILLPITKCATERNKVLPRESW